jgi:hypothetical protein
MEIAPGPLGDARFSLQFWAADMMGWGFLLATLLAPSLLYMVVLHRRALAERRRRRGGEWRLAARIYQAHHPRPTLAQEVGLVLRDLAGLVYDQPRALPFLAAILTSAAFVILAMDPLLVDPFFWPFPPLPLPEAVKFGWAGLVLLAALGHPIWVFIRAPAFFSRQWLVLHADGAISAEGASLPPLHLGRPHQAWDGITMPSPANPFLGLPAMERWAEGAVIAQGGFVVGFDTRPDPVGPGDLRNQAIMPRQWHQVALGPEPAPFLAMFRRHCPDAPRGVAPGW